MTFEELAGCVVAGNVTTCVIADNVTSVVGGTVTVNTVVLIITNEVPERGNTIDLLQIATS